MYDVIVRDDYDPMFDRPYDDDDEDEPTPNPYKGSCSDRMCGAHDCYRCHPENFQNGRYIDDCEEIAVKKSMRHCHFMILFNEMPFLKQKMTFLYDNFDQLIFYDLNIDTLEFSDDGSHEYIKEYPDPEDKIILIEKKNLDDIVRFRGQSFKQKKQMFAVGSELVRDNIDVFWCPDADEFFTKRLKSRVEEIFNTQPTIDSIEVNHFLYFKDLNHINCTPDGVIESFSDSAWTRIVRHKKGNVYGHCSLSTQWPKMYHLSDEFIHHFGYVGRSRVKFKCDLYGYSTYLSEIWDKLDYLTVTFPYGSPFIHPNRSVNWAVKRAKETLPTYINGKELMNDLESR